MAIVKSYKEHVPQVHESAFLAENAVVVGEVYIGESASIWYGAVLRGDVGSIRIGARTNIQDNATVHMTGGVSDALIEEDVTVGHNAVVHGATVRRGALIGMGSVILDNAEIGEGAIIAAGAVVPPRMKVPPRVLVRGTSAKVVRELTEKEALEGAAGAAVYQELALGHRG